MDYYALYSTAPGRADCFTGMRTFSQLHQSSNSTFYIYQPVREAAAAHHDAREAGAHHHTGGFRDRPDRRLLPPRDRVRPAPPAAPRLRRQ